MKKISFYSLFLTLLLLFGVTNAMAEVASFTPSATKIQGDCNGKDANYPAATNSGTNYYNAEATEWTINQSAISNGAFKNSNVNYGGSYILLAKFDCSAQLQGKIVKKATLKYTSKCTVSKKNSNVQLAKIGTDWEPSTATWASTNTSEIMQAEEITAAKTNVGTSAKNITVDVTELLSNDEDKVVAFALYTYTGREQKISNYSLEVEYVDASQTATVTVKYVDTAGNEIKESTSRDGVIRQPVTVNDNEKEPIYYEGTKYLYSKDDSEGLIVKEDDSTVLTITFRKAYTATLNVTTTINGESTPKKTDLVQADDNSCNWIYTYSLYALKDGVYYKADNTESFGEKGVFSNGEKIDKEVFYSTAEPDIVFFAENPVINSSGLNYSNGSNGYVAAQNMRDRGIAVGTLPVGQYSFEVNIVAANRRSVCLRESQNDPIASVGTSNEDKNIGLKTAIFTLNSATSNLYINGANSGEVKTNQSETFDYVIIRKTADLATVSSVGYATYSPSSNVAVPSEEEGIKVYTVTVNGDKTAVELHQVPAGSVIAAGTGYVLEAAEGSYPFAVSNDAVSDIGENALKVSDGNVTVGESDKIFVLAQRNGSVGFSIVNTGVTIPAGKAYLNLSAEAKVSFLSFGDDATAIESVETNNNRGNGEYYTLQGVRTSAPVKGLYIINGKKVVVK